jgi:purine-nucleoside phosphorylase
MLRSLGADLIGTSVVPEVIVARHMGMRVLGLGVVTDLCLPDEPAPTGLSEIIRSAEEPEPVMMRLLERIVAHL